MNVRLYLDGSKALWAHIRCDVCADVDKYPATEALQKRIRCRRCGHSMDVRDQVLADVAKRPDISLEGFIAMSGGARRQRPPEILDH